MKQNSEDVVLRSWEKNEWDTSIPDMVAEDFNGEHDFKTTLMAGFETGTQQRSKTVLQF